MTEFEMNERGVDRRGTEAAARSTLFKAELKIAEKLKRGCLLAASLGSLNFIDLSFRQDILIPSL